MPVPLDNDQIKAQYLENRSQLIELYPRIPTKLYGPQAAL